MPPKKYWINLPVKDVEVSKLGESYIIMLFQEEKFKTFTRCPLSDTKQGSEVLISIEEDSREEVDALAAAAENAGGYIFCKPTETDGWMYGCGFADIDGHRWNVLHMDFSKMPHSK